MDPVSLTLAAIPTAIQLYQVVMGAYNLYLESRDFPKAYRQLQLQLWIEHNRLTLWASHVMQEKLQEDKLQSPGELECWRIFEFIFREMLSAFEDSFGIMEGYQKSDVGSRQTRRQGKYEERTKVR